MTATTHVTPQTLQCAWAGVLSVSQPCPSVWNSMADYLRDPALGLYSFRRQSRTFLFAQRTERIVDIMTVRYVNTHLSLFNSSTESGC